MPDTQESHPAITIARYVVGVGSVLGFVWSVGFGIPHLLDFIAIPAYAKLKDLVPLSLLVFSPVGYLLTAEFCLFRWTATSRQEGIESCHTVIVSVVAVAAIGTISAWAAFGGWPEPLATLNLVLGFFMLWGFLLAFGIRKWRRMKRDVNAE